MSSARKRAAIHKANIEADYQRTKASLQEYHYNTVVFLPRL